MLFFPEEGHVRRWCDAWNQQPGYVMTLEQCWQLAYAWYRADRRAADWRRKTTVEAQAIFAQIDAGAWAESTL